MREVRTARLDVFEPLRIISARRIGAWVRIAVKHPADRSRTIVFRFATAREARRHHQQAATWIYDRTDVAYVRGPEECLHWRGRTLRAPRGVPARFVANVVVTIVVLDVGAIARHFGPVFDAAESGKMAGNADPGPIRRPHREG
jgi:hypothetical protein